MPLWMKELEDEIIYVGRRAIIELGEPVNRYNEPVKV